MGLSAAMYSGTSGLKVHGEDMTVIGNNISNVSTIGFKGSRMYFEDAMSQAITTAAGTGQVGRGVAVGAVMGDFSQGSLETTTEATDLAIGGNGFFVVSPAGEEINYYTRAGNFRFDQDGYLIDPHGYRVQGWEVLQESTSAVAQDSTTQEISTGVKIKGVPTDIKLENFQSPPQETSRIDMIVNVDSKSEDRSTDDINPFTALFSTYDGTKSEPLGDSTYAYQSTIKVYDQNGTAHTLSVYMDPVNHEDVANEAGGKRHWEYIITVPPNEDKREFWDGTNEEKRGILMAGTLIFNASGELENMSAFTLNNTGANPSNMNDWRLAEFSQNGYPICTANFLGADDASVVTGDEAKNIEINFGLRNKATVWSNPTTTMANLPTDPNINTAALDAIPGMGDTEISALSTTSYASGSTTIFQSQNGYTAGFLQNISVDRDGVLTGRYSNGQVLQLFALTLATFNNNYGLYREGGNLFSETRSSGPALTGLANTGDKGSIASNSLEQSNVDLATEFVKMITTEKGFQANSKTITTVDQMLTVLIQLKR